MWKRLMNEPVLMTAFVAAVLVLLVEFNVPLTEGQVGAIQAVIVAGAAFFARQQVTPTRKLNG